MDFFVASNGSTKLFRLDDTMNKVCQNIVIPSETVYGLSFIYAKDSVASPHIILTFNGMTAFETTVSVAGFKAVDTGGPLDADTMQMCIENNVATSAIYVDNIVLNMVNYPEVVTYQIDIDPSTINAILINIVFQDFFKEEYWVGGSLEGKMGLEVDGVEIAADQISQVENNADRIQLRVMLTESISPESTVLLTITENAFSLNSVETVTFTCTRSGEVPLVAIQSEEEIATIRAMSNVTQTVAAAVGTSSSSFSLLGATYLIANLFVFSNLIVLYNYLDLKWVLSPYKLIINQILEFFFSAGDLNVMLEALFGTSIVVEPQEEIEDQIQHSPSIDGMKEHGFSSQFWVNSWDELLNVGLMLVKLSMVRVMLWVPCKLVRRYCRGVGKKALIYLVYEVLAGAPMVLLPVGVMLGPEGGMGSINIRSKLNLAVFVSYSFFLFVAPFLLFQLEVELERKS